MYRSNLAIIGLPLATVLVPGADMGPVAMLAAIIVGAAIGAWLGSPLWKRGQARIHIRKA